MSFPVIEGLATGASGPTETDHIVTLPDGVRVGDLLIVVIGQRSTISTMTWPAGWTLMASSSSAAAQARYKIADGTEGASIIVTTSVNVRTAQHAFRISNFDPSIAPQATATLSVSDHDPLLLFSPAGTRDNLWLAVLYILGLDTVTGTPTDYTDSTYVVSAGIDSTASGMASVRRNLEASSEDPSAFALSGSDNSRVFTMVVAPLAKRRFVLIPS